MSDYLPSWSLKPIFVVIGCFLFLSSDPASISSISMSTSLPYIYWDSGWKQYFFLETYKKKNQKHD